jgi:phosphoglycerate dehydrogenase-like enzyme
MSQPQIAILDDYQQVAFQFADWTPVLAKAKVTVFSDHIDRPRKRPAKSAPVWSAKSSFSTPHIGYVTGDTYRIFYQDTVKAILEWLGVLNLTTNTPD